MERAVKLTEVEMDTGIQCRAAINTETVNDYAERMTAGDRFPPVDLFGTNGRWWIGDGWHRIMAARQIGVLSIDAVVRDGGRQDALKYALAANVAHGIRRTSADKRRCIEVALTEFGNLSSRAIAEMCGVHNMTVEKMRPVNNLFTPRIGRDGKPQPATTKGGDRKSAKTAIELRPPRNQPLAEKIKAITQMLAEGHNVEQIADALGNSVVHIRKIIFQNKLAELPKRGRGGAHIDAAHVVGETVNAISATGQGLKLIRNVELNIPQNEAAALLTELSEAMSALRWLVNELKRLSNG